MRHLFADGSGPRPLSDVDRTDLEHWRRELDAQVDPTVSLARAGATTPMPDPFPIRVPPPPPADADAVTAVHRQGGAHRSSRGWAFAVTVLVLLGLGGVASAAVLWALP